jgi:hypothetical protein
MTPWRCHDQNATLNTAPFTNSAITNVCPCWPLWRQFSSQWLLLGLILYSESEVS